MTSILVAAAAVTGAWTSVGIALYKGHKYEAIGIGCFAFFISVITTAVPLIEVEARCASDVKPDKDSIVNGKGSYTW